jgi:hypothetical protein
VNSYNEEKEMVEHALKDLFDDLDELNDCLHERECVGGPLHIITDDGNITDSDLLYCLRNLQHVNSTEESTVVRLVSLEMIRILLLLTEPQRLMWYLSGILEKYKQNPIGWAIYLKDGDIDRLENGEEIVKKCNVVLWKGLTAMEKEWLEKTSTLR